MIIFIEMLVERRFRRGHGGEDENPYGTSTTTTTTIQTTTTTSEPEPSDDNDCFDLYGTCVEWAADGQCESVEPSCRKSCGTCDIGPPVTAGWVLQSSRNSYFSMIILSYP